MENSLWIVELTLNFDDNILNPPSAAFLQTTWLWASKSGPHYNFPSKNRDFSFFEGDSYKRTAKDNKKPRHWIAADKSTFAHSNNTEISSLQLTTGQNGDYHQFFSSLIYLHADVEIIVTMLTNRLIKSYHILRTKMNNLSFICRMSVQQSPPLIWECDAKFIFVLTVGAWFCHACSWPSTCPYPRYSRRAKNFRCAID